MVVGYLMVFFFSFLFLSSLFLEDGKGKVGGGGISLRWAGRRVR